MRTRSWFTMALAAAVMLASVPGVASAASSEVGTVEFGLDATVAHSSHTFDGEGVAKRDDVSVTTGVGHCMTDLLELKGSLIFNYVSVNPEG